MKKKLENFSSPLKRVNLKEMIMTWILGSHQNEMNAKDLIKV